MQPRPQKVFARVILGLVLLGGLAWLARLDFGRKISSDVLELIPRNEREPELGLVRALASEQQARAALFALSAPRDREAAALAFTTALARSPAIAETVRMDDTAARDALGRYVFEHRFDLLLPGWLEQRRRRYERAHAQTTWTDWLARDSVSALEAFLATPEALAFEELLPSDPLLLVPTLARQARALADPAQAAGADGTVLIWTRTAASPLVDEGQQPLFAAVDSALAEARHVAPDAELRWTAVSRFAAESRERIRSEMSVLNLVSLAAVLGVAALAVRRVLKVLHLAPVIGFALLGAWVATTALFARVHVLVFVVGSLLGGVAIDYGFYLFLQPRRPGEPYVQRVRRLLKPLLASALTTVLGFSLLLFSDLPLIRQLGVFVSAGLLCALGAALLWFAQVDEPTLATRRFIQTRPSPVGRGARRVAAIVLLLGGAVAVLGPWRLHWHDDIRELEIPAPELHANDRSVRALFGESPDRAIYLTRGDSPADARAALERFLAWHATAFPETDVASPGMALPTAENWETLPARLEELRKFPDALRAELARNGFSSAEFEPFFRAWREWVARESRPTYDALARDFAAALRGPLALLMGRSAELSWFSTVAEHAPGDDPPAATNTVSTGQLESLNRLFARYRQSALRLSAIGLGLVGLSVFALYGWRRGARVFAIPAGACLFTFGLFGLTGQTLNLFHLLGAFLGVCLSHNYAIFSIENALAGEAPPPSIRLSALTTAASFGVLALSKIPVVAALGSTVAIIVLAALAIVEIGAIVRTEADGSRRLSR